MTAEVSIQVALALPLIAVVLTPLFGRHPNLREMFTLLSSVGLFLVVTLLVPEVFSGSRPTITLLEVMPGLALAFNIEPLGMLFALVASGLWIVTTCYSIGYMRAHNENHQTRFYTCFSMAILAAMGVAMAQNMFTLFVFYELLTLSTYPLVTHHGTESARKGGRIYLGILAFTSIVFLLLAITWTWNIAGTLDFKPGGVLAGKASNGLLFALLTLYVFGIGKAAVMPFHRWLPAAMVAPAPVSALLHAVAVVKVGVFTVMKVVVYIFGLDLLQSTKISVPLMYVAGVTVLLGSVLALTKDNLKARLAYSTVSQLSYVVLGAVLANAWGVIGGSMHIAMHAFGKITLFFCAGAIYVTTHKTEVSQMRGIGRTMPITMFAFFLGSLSIIGLPPLGGSWSKWFLVLGTAQAHQQLLVAVLMVSSLLSIGYLIPISVRGFFLTPSEGSGRLKVKEAPIFCVVPLCITAVGGVALFFLAEKVYELLEPVAQI